MSGGAAPSGSGVLERAQGLRAAEERVKDMRRTLGTLERKEAMGRWARDAWRARTREVEIKELELRFLQEHVGTNNYRPGASFLISLPFGPSLDEVPATCFRSACN